MLWTVFNECAGELLANIDVQQESVRKFFDEWLRKMIHTRLAEFIKCYSINCKEAKGKHVKGGQTLRDELYSFVRKPGSIKRGAKVSKKKAKTRVSESSAFDGASTSKASCNTSKASATDACSSKACTTGDARRSKTNVTDSANRSKTNATNATNDAVTSKTCVTAGANTKKAKAATSSIPSTVNNSPRATPRAKRTCRPKKLGDFDYTY